jgi:peptidylprolyl isomerase
MRFVAVLTVLAASTAALALSPAPQQAQQDYESLPPPPKEVQTKLDAAKVSLEQAVDAAEKAMNGQVLLARFAEGTDGPVYEIVVTSGGLQKKVTVDGTTGKVTGATLTLPSAVKKATEKTGGGKVKDAVTNFTIDPPQYTVVVFKGDQRHDVLVNAVDGSIISDTLVAQYPGIEFKGELQKTPSGLQFVDIQEGHGIQPDPASVVKVHYTGYLNNGQKFDSSVDRGEPAQFSLSGVIPGWTEGVGSMKVGGKRKLIVPYKLAYGERGRGGHIPPKATLIFDVELLEVVSNTPPAAPATPR